MKKTFFCITIIAILLHICTVRAAPLSKIKKTVKPKKIDNAIPASMNTEVNELFNELSNTSDIQKAHQRLKELVVPYMVCELLYKIIFKHKYYTNEEKISLIDSVLLRANLDIDNDNRTTLRNFKVIMQIFIKPSQRINPNSVLYRSPKETILHWASKMNQTHTVKILLKYGAKVDPRNQWNKTPLHYAAQWNAPKVAAILFEYGANPIAKDKYRKIPLDYAREYKNKEVLAVIEKNTTIEDIEIKKDEKTSVEVKPRPHNNHYRKNKNVKIKSDPIKTPSHGTLEKKKRIKTPPKSSKQKKANDKVKKRRKKRRGTY